MTSTAHLLTRSWQAWLDNDLEPPGPAWWQWIWTVLFAVVIALGFTVLGLAMSRHPSSWLDAGLWWRWFRANFVVSLIIALLIHALFALLIPAVGKARLRSFSHRKRALFFVAVPLTGVAIGWPLGLWLISGGTGWVRFSNPGQLVGSAMLALVVSFVIFLVFNARAQQAYAEKRATEARLRLLQAQMEPHFLFNTLANVVTLIELDPAKARQMLESFTDYLRSSLGRLRDEHSTVGAELDLASTYLTLMQHRMDDRLRFELDCPDALRGIAVPALLLQPLVENAVHHGLEPKVEGGCVRIRVASENGQLLLSVSDDGMGLHSTRPGLRSGCGMALDNMRQRLHARHGEQASLTLQDASPGTLAQVRLPLPAA